MRCAAITWKAGEVLVVTVDARRDASAASAMLSRAGRAPTESSGMGVTLVLTKPTDHAPPAPVTRRLRRGHTRHSALSLPAGSSSVAVKRALSRPNSVAVA